MAKHALRMRPANMPASRRALVEELRGRYARALVDRNWSPWDEPLIGRHRLGEAPTPLREAAVVETWPAAWPSKTWLGS